MTPALAWEQIVPEGPLDPDKLWMPVGGICQNYNRAFSDTAAATIISQRLHLAGGAVLEAGRTITSISFWSQAAAVTPANQWFCIVDRDTLALLAITVDDGATAWAADTLKTLALSAPFQNTLNREIYIGVMVNAATTPTIAGNAPRIGVVDMAVSLGGHSSAALTNPASCPNPVAAPVATNRLPWALLNGT